MVQSLICYYLFKINGGQIRNKHLEKSRLILFVLEEKKLSEKQPNSELKKAIENHETAAWSNVEKQKETSLVSIPSLFQTENAKEHVDNNQK